MKHKRKGLIASVLTFFMLGGMIAVAYAATDASAHLDAYRAGCTALSGSMVAVTVDVDGTGLMDDIGAVNIHVYRSTDNKHFYHLRTFSYEDFPAMMTHNAYHYYDTPITFQGVAGCYYYANVDVYAAKDGSSSTRTYMTNVVQAAN